MTHMMNLTTKLNNVSFATILPLATSEQYKNVVKEDLSVIQMKALCRRFLDWTTIAQVEGLNGDISELVNVDSPGLINQFIDVLERYGRDVDQLFHDNGLWLAGDNEGQRLFLTQTTWVSLMKTPLTIKLLDMTFVFNVMGPWYCVDDILALPFFHEQLMHPEVTGYMKKKGRNNSVIIGLGFDNGRFQPIFEVRESIYDRVRLMAWASE